MLKHKYPGPTDNGGEFCSGQFEEFQKCNGIRHLKTNVYSPEMNGTAERLNRSIVEGVRTMLTETRLPRELWDELVNLYVYAKNRFPHRRINNEIPYVRWNNRSLSVKHLRVPGCLSFVYYPTRRRSKFDDKAWVGALAVSVYGSPFSPISEMEVLPPIVNTFYLNTKRIDFQYISK